mgnify:CR=1 FL=1
MQSLYDFIVEPVGDTYENEIDIENVKIILNTKIESFKFVNNVAKVIQVPLAFKTEIKKGAFIGSDVMLVAPVTVGEGAMIGAGSVITKDVPPKALGIERSNQKNIDGYMDRKKSKDEND